MAEIEDNGDVAHRQALAMRLSDRLVALDSELFRAALDLPLAPGEVAGENGKLGASLGCFALRSGDSVIVDPIFANRLARTGIYTRAGGLHPRK